MSGRAIAATLGIPEGAARVRLSRALHKLTIEYHRSEGMLERDSEK
jgi:DNA-directed RNA polymerase specialized sigma24 family protein